ncbi:uncharacterized protein LY89DRAFT_678722 [Mollisia scopiformis]|uniref:Uncharacterized protein n=1 Tax=Mollisia scopiformis TaxID=149040 RepID=A0A132B2A8_MOLSC|nr:uncharacterized protein LY89DRAFT_678722 [Mollisia scopiformis]KUJ06451.1 hypothetical protein LY89DRAFT_678722 [Mollisia scopiformis]
MTMFSPLRDPDDFGDVLQDFDSIELESQSSKHSRTSNTPSHDLESQRQMPKTSRSVSKLLTFCCLSNNRESSTERRKCNMDTCLSISLILKNSFCAILAAGISCLVIALVILVIRNTPDVDEIIKKIAGIAEALGPQDVLNKVTILLLDRNDPYPNIPCHLFDSQKHIQIDLTWCSQEFIERYGYGPTQLGQMISSNALGLAQPASQRWNWTPEMSDLGLQRIPVCF